MKIMKRKKRRRLVLRSRRIAFTVSFDIPEDATELDCRTYLQDAVETWRGSLRPPGGHDNLDPGDPMHGLNPETVRVSRRHARRRKVTT